MDTDKQSEFITAYLLDPEAAKGQLVENMHQKVTEDGVVQERLMLTEAQMAGPMYLNSAEDAQHWCEFLKEKNLYQQHEIPSLAAKGKLQFDFAQVKRFMKNIDRETVGVSSKADLTAAQYNQMKEHMSNNKPSLPPDSKPQAKKARVSSSSKAINNRNEPSVEESPEKIARTKALDKVFVFFCGN